jgi:uncharacterized protein (DUF1330 family)
MAGYLIHNGTLTDPEGYKAYMAKAEKVVAQYGGRYLVRGGRTEPIDGDWHPRFVVVEFPTFERAGEFYHSPGYQGLGEISERTSVSANVIVDGLDPAP